MNIFNRFKNVFISNRNTLLDIKTLNNQSKDFYEEFEKIIFDSYDEFFLSPDPIYSLKIYKLSTYRNNVLSWSDEKKVNFLLYQIKMIDICVKNKKKGNYSKEFDQFLLIRYSYIEHIIKTRIQITEIDVKRLIEVFLSCKSNYFSTVLDWPIAHFLRRIKSQYGKSELSDSMLKNLSFLKKQIENVQTYNQKEKLVLIEKLESLLLPADLNENTNKPILLVGEDDLKVYTTKIIEEMPEGERKYWYELIALARKKGRGIPSKKFLSESNRIINELGIDKFKKIVVNWFNFIIEYEDDETSDEFLIFNNLDTMRGFVWMCSLFYDATVVHSIFLLANFCYSSFKEKDARSPALGNACFYTLSQTKGMNGIKYLIQLKKDIKQKDANNLICKYLLRIEKKEIAQYPEKEDLNSDDWGLKEGKKTIYLESEENTQARLSFNVSGKIKIIWVNALGSEQEHIPKYIKKAYNPELKKIRTEVRCIEKELQTQIDRIDKMLRYEYEFDWDYFEKHFFNHGLISFISRKLIWNFKLRIGNAKSVIYFGERWLDLDSNVVRPNEWTKVSLWHPMNDSDENINNWRTIISRYNILQPFKQAFRETYYSAEKDLNEVSGHILKQKEFNSLAKSKGWNYRPLGNFNDGREFEYAEYLIPSYNLKACLRLKAFKAGGSAKGSQIWNLIQTDTIQFRQQDNEEVIDSSKVPLRLFSEILRDIDLIIDITNIGSNHHYLNLCGIDQYWATYFSGKLSEPAKIRKEILIRQIKRLKVSKAIQVNGNYLIINGKYNIYKIHLGNSQIFVLPEERLIDIKPDLKWKKDIKNLYLPFEGMNDTLIQLLVKIMMLINDDKIKDQTILSQILKEN